MDSQISKFYKKNRLERLDIIKDRGFISKDIHTLYKEDLSLDEEISDSLIENQIGQFNIPLGLALNFLIDGKEYVVPMATEEPSVIAAASNAARMARPHGFHTEYSEMLNIGQIIFSKVKEPEISKKKIIDNKNKIIELSREVHPSIYRRGGGIKDLDVKIIKDNENTFLTCYIYIDVKDAMGANIINTILEGVSEYMESLVDGSLVMAILSNLNTKSLVKSSCKIAIDKLDKDYISGREVAEKITEANRYAQLDPYRAATHNKGIMNGIDSLIIASGNDPRAVEAGIHAYAAKDGRYKALTSWYIEEDQLIGEIELPLAIGIVGGAISVLPKAQANLELMRVESAKDLASIVASVGLAQNFAALNALVSDGIQKGHMKLHYSSLAIQVGAKGEEIDLLVSRLRNEKIKNSQVAKKILLDIRK